MQRNLLSVLLLLALLFCSGCGESISKLNQFAASGSIQADAPVRTQLQIEINAPLANVWKLVVDAKSWPKWQPAIESVTTTGPLAKGTTFSWKIGGTSIHSQIQLFEPEHRLGWTGTALVTKAVHIWELKEESPNRTLVVVKESMDGPCMAKIYPSEELTQADRSWLASLKQAAEADKKLQ